jgi:hypothetical protein
MKRAVGMVCVALALSGCVTRTVYVYPELPVPSAPVLPVVPASEFIDLAGDEDGDELVQLLGGRVLVCLPAAGYEALAVRDATRRGYADELRQVILEHNRRAAAR